jgi:hypothetical protein
MSIRNKYITALVTLVLCYLIYAFIGANLNPFEWSAWVRLLFLISLFLPNQLDKKIA